MNKLDLDYQNLLNDILENGTKKETRNGGTISVFGRQIRHSMKDGFPLLTTKKMYTKGIIAELLWFLRGDTNIKFLVDNDCHIWDGDCYQAYLKNWKPENPLEELDDPYRLISGTNLVDERPLPKDMFIHCIKKDDEFAKKWGDLGPIYGSQWRNWVRGVDYDVDYENGINDEIDQIANLINDLKNNPDSRRLMVNAWNVGELEQMVLPPCHYGFQVYTRELSDEERYDLIEKDKYTQFVNWQNLGTDRIREVLDEQNIPKRAISLMFNMRSVDTGLGLSFNIGSYALLLEIIAKTVNMVPDELIGNLGDCHIYSNQIDGVKEQIGRDMTTEERMKWWSNNNKPSRDFWDYVDLLPENLKNVFFDENKVPKRTREPFELPTLKFGKTDEFFKSLGDDLSLLSHLEISDFIVENYQSHPTIKMPLSN